MLGVASVGFRGILLLGIAILLRISYRKWHCDLSLDGLISSICSIAIALLMLRSSREYNTTSCFDKLLLAFPNISKVIVALRLFVNPC
jgi:hypothetical protein